MKITRQSIINFIKSLFWHLYSGSPKSSQELIDNRLSICKTCDLFDRYNSQCLECGCNINNKKIFLNKLAWADQRCPLNKW
jgi:hypothetical protein